MRNNTGRNLLWKEIPQENNFSAVYTKTIDEFVQLVRHNRIREP